MENKMAAQSIQRTFLAVSSILEKFLFEKMCSELKTPWKSVRKIIQKAFKKMPK